MWQDPRPWHRILTFDTIHIDGKRTFFKKQAHLLDNCRGYLYDWFGDPSLRSHRPTVRL